MSLKRKTGPRPRPIVKHPKPTTTKWKDPKTFRESLILHMRRHGDTPIMLAKAISKPRDKCWASTIRVWRRGGFEPNWAKSLGYLNRIERRYKLPTGYFKNKLAAGFRHAVRPILKSLTSGQRTLARWHLPKDFHIRSHNQQQEIISWLRENVFTGASEYSEYQKAHSHPYSVRFSSIVGGRRRSTKFKYPTLPHGIEPSAVVEAPARLSSEMRSLVKFKTAVLTEHGYRRLYVWSEATVGIKLRQFGFMLGALAASPKSAIRGLGIAPAKLTLGLLAFPTIWDWYLNWRERRRGFFTVAESEFVLELSSLTRLDTGWIRQHPELAGRLSPIKGILSDNAIKAAHRDWGATCETARRYAKDRIRDIRRVARTHRDTFHPIMAVLEADSPLGEYRKIADEIMRRMPDERIQPLAVAEACRTYLMLRLGMHAGLRQKNFRELLFCAPAEAPRPERQLEALRRGELRWSKRAKTWELFIPVAAFKNSYSSFFNKKPYRMILPDVELLYEVIQRYIQTHRAVLLAGRPDPGTFFVRTARGNRGAQAYTDHTFTAAWRLAIQRYGIHNPYTGHGAIQGLLPHGPHSIRDVLATHILKQTGSYELASYAIQSTPEVVAKHYGRFLPQDKTAQAAAILNQVWAFGDSTKQMVSEAKPPRSQQSRTGKRQRSL